MRRFAPSNSNGVLVTARAASAAVLELSYQLADLVTDDAAFTAGAFTMLDRLLPSESTGRFSFDLLAGSAYLASNPAEHSTASYCAKFVAAAPSHPTLVDLRKHPDDHGPRRVSDLIELRQFSATAFYNELYRPSGLRDNIAFLVHPFGISPLTVGWSFSRRSHFADDELDLAGRIQPVLAALDGLRSQPRWSDVSPALIDDARARVGLTVRELDILSLVGAGMTRSAVGRARRISPRTVSKHLERIYVKLGVSDRLLAVSKARTLGLLPPLGTDPVSPVPAGEYAPPVVAT